MKTAGVVVEAEQERADGARRRLVPAKTGDDAVGGARVLDLEHRALAGRVRARHRGFAITPSSPAPSNRASQSRGERAIARHRGEVQRRRRLAPSSARAGRAPVCASSRMSCAVNREQIERDERRRRLARQFFDPRRGRMQAHLQRVEVETVCATAITISPSTTQRGRQRARSAACSSGK